MWRPVAGQPWGRTTYAYQEPRGVRGSSFGLGAEQVSNPGYYGPWLPSWYGFDGYIDERCAAGGRWWPYGAGGCVATGRNTVEKSRRTCLSTRCCRFVRGVTGLNFNLVCGTGRGATIEAQRDARAAILDDALGLSNDEQFIRIAADRVLV
ncbi:unnamed protein product [Pedinophyceae sp. YPF-701]|nr:unnamed protein product [Pedinophyceae sp. YPF-701]